MTEKLEFGSTRQFLEFAASEANLLKNGDDDVLLFRGESNKYGSMLPSVYRQPAHKHDHFHALVHNLAEHLLSDVLRPYLTNGHFYKGEWIGGDLAAAEDFTSNPGYLWVVWQLEALLQHYGWPTSCIDITFDPTVAAFFASLDFSSRALITEGVGHVYVWTKRTLRSDTALTFRAPVIALDRIAWCVADLLQAPSIRPHAQDAAILRIPYGHQWLDDVVQALRVEIQFGRHDAADVLHGFSHYFPDDPLSAMLDRFEGKYLDYCRNLPPNATGELWPEFVAFLETWRAGKAKPGRGEIRKPSPADPASDPPAGG